MKVELLKDIVIPKGTIFSTAPVMTKRNGEGHVEHVFGLTKDSYGTVNYSLDADENLKDWFKAIE